VLCGNYLLRDYLRAAVAAAPPGMSSNALRPLAPQPRAGIHSLAYALHHALAGAHGLDAEQIRGQFLDLASPRLLAQTRIAPTRAGLRRLFSLAFGSSPDIRVHWAAGAEPRFALADSHGPAHAAYLDVVNQQGERLGTLQASDHGVTFAAGQILLIGHKPHRVQDVLEQTVHARHVEGAGLSGIPRYAFHRRYRLDLRHALSEHRLAPRELPGGYRLCASHLHAGVARQTLGYLSLDAAMRPLAAATPAMSYQPCEPSIQSARTQQSCAEIHIGLPADGADRARLAFTLCALIGDAMESLFPEQHRRIAVVSPQAGRAPAAPAPAPTSDLDAETAWLLERLYPAVTFQTPVAATADTAAEPADGITLFIIEDSAQDLGVARSLSDDSGLNHLLQLLRNYLRWQAAAPEAGAYHAFGADDICAAFDYPAALALLERIAPAGTTPATADLDAPCTLPDLPAGADDDGVCDFCAGPLGATYHRLQDGRMRCSGCGDDAIDTPEAFRALHREVVEHMERDYRIQLPRDLELRLVSAPDMAAALGQRFMPTPGLDPRAVGLAIQTRDGARCMLIENGAPRIATFATLAHELTHLWQFEQLPDTDAAPPDLELMELMEGQARLVEIDLLHRRGGRALALALKLEAEAGDDIYARGYRRAAPCAGSAPADLFPCLLAQLPAQ
jgi:hypothetical protein